MIWHPAALSIPLFLATTLFLKLISYALVSADLRRESLLKVHPDPVEDSDSASPEPISNEHSPKFNPATLAYPHNITLSNLIYFVFASTLSYQLVYPRTRRIRKVFIAKRTLKLVIALAGMYFLCVQYASPTLRNSIEAMDRFDRVRLAGRLLKLSVIGVVVWLLMFWSFFHCWLNILAELLCFGDRRFYLTWWNARDISEYWRLWNSPVYNWSKRYVYLPLMLNHGVPPMLATVVVFAVSALLHELLVGIPTHCLNGVAFWGMMAQVPLIFLFNSSLEGSRKLLRRPKNDMLFDTIGNYMFWISFTIVGQPACVLLYYTQWYKKNAM